MVELLKYSGEAGRGGESSQHWAATGVHPSAHFQPGARGCVWLVQGCELATGQGPGPVA